MTRITITLVAAASLCLSIAAPTLSAAQTDQPAASQPVAPDKLDKLMGPIALYPDALVLQILESSVDPDQVKKLGDWMNKNASLKGTAAQDAAVAEGFGASYVALVMFPQVVKMMNEQPDWTKDVGKAFTGDRPGTFASLQRLRSQAQAVGNLKTSEQQEVETVTTSGGQQVIVIQPANPEVVYVPQYNPTVVYTQPPPPPPPGQSAAAGLIGFTTGVIIGAAIADNNNDCWGYHGGMSNDNYNDYAEHRENMASQRGENQGQRQSSRTENQANRQASSSANQGQRQDARASGQGASGQSASSQSAGGKQAGSGSARGSAQGASASQRSGSETGAMSGYQSGAKEREASSRGRSSQSSSASRGGGGASRGGGGGGGGRRGR